MTASTPALCDRCSASLGHREDDLLRCECGSLMARFVDGQVELKCRRCKRTVRVPIDGTATP